MPKLIPVPDELSKPFWEAANERRLVVQHCTSCDALQFPPRPACQECGSDSLDWQETSGRGQVLANVIVMDSHLQQRAADQPFNLAVVALEEEPRINFYANLPGTPVGEVPVGATAEVIFDEVDPQQFVPDWRLVG